MLGQSRKAMKDNRGTDFSKTDEMSPSCLPRLFAVSATECPENYCKFEKNYLLVLP